MMREIRRLQQKSQDLETQRDTLEEENAWIEQIMLSLKDDGLYLEIINRLKRGDSHQVIAEWLGRPLVSECELSPDMSNRLNHAIEKYHGDLVGNNDPRYWTNVTRDVSLIEHLISLYLTWVHPTHMLFDEERFMSSFRNCVDTYCSSALVNAICATSCLLLHTAWDDGADEDSRNAIASLRSRFIDEARVLLSGVDRTKMTRLQTYAIMFLSELGSGNGLMATSHLRLATEALVEKSIAEQSFESEEVSSWGILTLHTAWSSLTYVKPSAPISTKASVFKGIDLGKDGHWHMGDQSSESSSNSNRPSYTILTASEMAKLYRIIHETVLIYCGVNGKVSASHLLQIYRRFVQWKEELAPQICDVASDNDALPHVLSLHISYFAAIVNVFKPLLCLPDTPREAFEVVSDILLRHAYKGLELLVQYRDVHGAFYQSPLQLFCVVQICDAIIKHDAHGISTSEVIRFCIEDLQDAKAGYPLAGPLQRMFATSVAESNVAIPSDLERLIGPSHQYQVDDLLNACTRLSYQVPVAQLRLNMRPTLAQDFVDEWRKASDEEQHVELQPRTTTGAAPRISIHINELLNK